MIDLAPFVGRRYELGLFNDLLQKRTASLVVINGRRRVGKSRLINQFAEGTTFYQFVGLAPTEKITAQDQRDEFSILLSQQTDVPQVQADDWSKLFKLLADKVSKGRVILLFDEITWMAHNDGTFLSKLKNAWELHFKKNPQLILILCGSISAWIEKNIISSTGYFGRVSLHLKLEQLPLHRCNQLMQKLGHRLSTEEKLTMLSFSGGVPWYIEQMKPQYSSLDNIKSLCFDQNGLLINELQYIFHDLFGRRSGIYAKIVRLLVNRSLGYEDIAKKLQYSKGSALTSYLNELIQSGYISQYTKWDFKTAELSTLSKYRLSDNFLRFYLKYVEKHLPAIKKGRFRQVDLTALPGWWSMLGLQLENLVLSNRNLILDKLNIKHETVINDDPYFQRGTKELKGCQIDYLIQTRSNTLYLCEIRFSHNTLSTKMIKEVKNKIDSLKVPKKFAVIPVLIHFNEVSNDVIDADYFHQIIDFSAFLQLDE